MAILPSKQSHMNLVGYCQVVVQYLTLMRVQFQGVNKPRKMLDKAVENCEPSKKGSMAAPFLYNEISSVTSTGTSARGTSASRAGGTSAGG